MKARTAAAVRARQQFPLHQHFGAAVPRNDPQVVAAQRFDIEFHFFFSRPGEDRHTFKLRVGLPVRDSRKSKQAGQVASHLNLHALAGGRRSDREKDT
jgi:hypothetical protein